MFKFLKERLKKSISIFSKKVEEEGEIEETVLELAKESPETVAPVAEVAIEDEPEITEEKTEKPKKGFFKKLFSRKNDEEVDHKEEVKTEAVEEVAGVDLKIESKTEKEIKDVLGEEKTPDKPEVSEQVVEKEQPLIVPRVEPEVKPLKEETKESVEEEKPGEIIEEEKPEEKIDPIEKVTESITKEDEKAPDDVVPSEVKHEEEDKIKDEVIEEPKKGFFKKLAEKVMTTKIKESKFDELFWDLEVALMENNVAVEVIDKIKDDLKNDIVDKPIKRGHVEEFILKSLRVSIEDLLDRNGFNLLEKINEKKPYVICFVGVNGSGKTTTIAKIAKLLLDKNKSVVLAAADTFRAAAIDQLGVHADNLGVKMIKHDYGSDPAAVAYDAIKYAKSKDVDVVLVDTAGRLHTNTNLIDEMKKIIRVSEPDLKIFVGESITGNDCVEQAVKFNEAIDIDGIILSKADIDEKGGVSISISYVTKKPILYIGVGQEYSDLIPFDRDEILKNIGLSS